MHVCAYVHVEGAGGDEGQFLFIPQHPEEELIKGVPW